MEIIKTHKNYITDRDYKPEWLGNLIIDVNDRLHFVYADPKRDEEEETNFHWKEELPKVVGEQVVKLLIEINRIEEKLDKRPTLDGEVLKTIYDGKSADDIIKLISEGIC